MQEIIVTVGAQLAEFNCIYLSFDIWIARNMEKIYPSKPMECMHGNTIMCTLEYHIQKLKLMESISEFTFEINGRFYHSIKSHCVYKRRRIKFEDMSGYIVGKSYEHRNLPHTTNYLSKILFSPWVTRCTQGSRFRLQVRGLQGHIRHLRCNDPKKYHGLVLNGRRRVHLVQEN